MHRYSSRNFIKISFFLFHPKGIKKKRGTFVEVNSLGGDKISVASGNSFSAPAVPSPLHLFPDLTGSYDIALNSTVSQGVTLLRVSFRRHNLSIKRNAFKSFLPRF